MPHAQFRDPDSRGEAGEDVAAPRSGDESHEGLGRVLVAVYIVLAIAATARSVYQILVKFDEAPIAYSLSAAAGAVYIVAAVALIKRWRALAWGALGFELLGVLVVGTLSLTHSEMFGHETVWSQYGSGYLWVPLALPVLGMMWLRRGDREDEPGPEHDPEECLY